MVFIADFVGFGDVTWIQDDRTNNQDMAGISWNYNGNENGNTVGISWEYRDQM